MHEGHRGRMFQKLKAGGVGMAEHEVLEMLLYNAMPRKNTNPLAHALLDRFGSVEGVFAAGLEELQQVQGLGRQGASYLCCIGLFYKKCANNKILKKPKKYEPQAFEAFLKEYYSTYNYEIFDFFFIDDDCNILQHKTITSYQHDRVTVNPGEMSHLIAGYGGKGLIIGHTHPGGDCQPSEMDDRTTKQCELLCSINNVRLLDHYVYGNGELFSYYRNGRMAQISKEYHIKTVLEERYYGEECE